VLALNAGLVWAFIHQPFFLIPEAVGCFTGSFCAVYLDNRKRKPPQLPS
jgi:hypothetical protein